MIDLEAIRRTNPLPAVAARIVPLRAAGREWLACCPFHPDRSPSFTIFDGGRRFSEIKRNGFVAEQANIAFRWTETVSGTLRSGEEWQWVKAAKFGEYPLSVTGRKFAKLLADGLF